MLSRAFNVHACIDQCLKFVIIVIGVGSKPEELRCMVWYTLLVCQFSTRLLATTASHLVPESQTLPYLLPLVSGSSATAVHQPSPTSVTPWYGSHATASPTRGAYKLNQMHAAGYNSQVVGSTCAVTQVSWIGRFPVNVH